jgi:CHASE2 domain-containing sensor protein
VARFADVAGRNSFDPWLDARPEPAVGGGSTLTGTIGLHPAVRAFIAVLAGVAGLIAVGALTGGVRLLVSGHLSGLVPAVLAPLAVAAIIAGLRSASLRLPQQPAGELIPGISDVLGLAAASADPAADGSSS